MSNIDYNLTCPLCQVISETINLYSLWRFRQANLSHSLWITCWNLWINRLNWGKVARLFEKPAPHLPHIWGYLFITSHIARLPYVMMNYRFFIVSYPQPVWGKIFLPFQFFSLGSPYRRTRFNEKFFSYLVVHISPSSTTTTILNIIININCLSSPVAFPSNRILVSIKSPWIPMQL